MMNINKKTKYALCQLSYHEYKNQTSPLFFLPRLLFVLTITRFIQLNGNTICYDKKIYIFS